MTGRRIALFVAFIGVIGYILMLLCRGEFAPIVAMAAAAAVASAYHKNRLVVLGAGVAAAVLVHAVIRGGGAKPFGGWGSRQYASAEGMTKLQHEAQVAAQTAAANKKNGGASSEA